MERVVKGLVAGGVVYALVGTLFLVLPGRQPLSLVAAVGFVAAIFAYRWAAK